MKSQTAVWVTRILAIILAVLMLGSIAAIFINSFALDPASAAMAVTGEGNTPKWVAIACAVAAVAIIGLVVVPKLSKKGK